MTNFKIFLFIFLNFIVIHAKISDYRKCANADCSEPISLAKTILRYTGDDSRILSFAPNTPVKIFSKEAGTRLDLWGAEINGKRGYIPIGLVRETKILKSKFDVLVRTEGEDDPAFKSAPTISTENPHSEPASEATPSTIEVPVQDIISPNAVTPPYEVIDGTTIYLSPGDNSRPDYSSTPSSVDSSEVEQSENLSESKTETIIPDSKSVIDNLNSGQKTKEDIKKVEEINSETITLDFTTNIDNLAEKSETKELKNVQDNNISKEDNSEGMKVDDTVNLGVLDKISKFLFEDEVDNEIDDEDENTEDDDDNDDNENEEDEEEVETSIEIQNRSKIITEENNLSAHENLPESVKASTIENNPDPVISSPESVQNTVDHLNDYNVVDPEPAQIEPKIETQTESQPILEAKEEEKQKDETNATIIEEKKQKTEEINVVPSDFSNPLNLFRQPLQEEKDELNNDAPQIQVPENLLILNNESQPSSLPVEEIIPTTQASVDEYIPPVDDFKEVFNENPIVVNDQILQPIVETFEVSAEQPETKTNEIIEHLQQAETKSNEIIDEKIEQTVADIEETVENIVETSSEQTGIKPEVLDGKIEEIIDDKAEEPTFIDAVGYNSLVAEEIPQNNNNLGQNIENVSFEPIVEKLTAEKITEQSEIVEEIAEKENEEPGFFSKIFNSVFSSGDEQVAPIEETVTEENIKNNEIVEEIIENPAEQTSGVYDSLWSSHVQEKPVEKYLPANEPEVPNQSDMQQSCASIENPALCGFQKDYDKREIISEEISWPLGVPENAYNIFLYLSLTAVTVLLFSLGFYYIEKKRKDCSLICSINTLEKKLLISSQECLLLQDELATTKERLVSIENSSFGSDEMVTSLKEEVEQAKAMRSELDEQVTNLEKELENATEAGMELNRMLREILTSQSGNDHLIQNVEHLQKQLNEQQETINNMKATLSTKNTENELLQTELSVANGKNVQLQDELDKLVVNLLSVQQEKNNIENKLEEQNETLKTKYETTIKQINSEVIVLKDENKKLKQKIEDTQRFLDFKNNEYDLLKQGMKEIQGVQSNKDSIMALLDVSHVKAEVQQLRDEKHKISEKLQKEFNEKTVFEKEIQVMIQEVKLLKNKFDEAEKEKVEAQTRLEVLSGYFKEKEAQLQKEINENESKFTQKEGEATSTIERIKWIQDELQNYKAQNELLKKEILDQEVSLKSQISMLEKKSHDNWVNSRQAERRLEESKQEASQLRNRLTIVEKNLNNSTHIADESKLSNRIMSPLESNGELPVSPLLMGQIEPPVSPPLLFPHRDHMPTSQPLPGMPPFMPPPPGVPFMPPPLPGVPPFMPPPPSLFPGDHRPPPLGRMSSPPLHGRYSPDSRTYSPYDRDVSPPLSPSYPDSDYRRRSPPPPTSHMSMTYSPYSGKSARPPPHWELDEERERDYRGPQHRNKPRTHKGLSSGSGNSNESLHNSGRHSGRV